MKNSASILIIIISLFFSNCKTQDNPVTHINCDGLITDTSGTNDNGRIYMPNAFSPNNDGLNDICRPITQNISSLVFTIYDENNNIVFTTTQLAQGWQPVTGSNISSKFYYKIQANTVGNRKIGKCGEVYKLTCFPGNVPKSNFSFEDQLTSNGFTGITAEILPTCL